MKTYTVKFRWGEEVVTTFDQDSQDFVELGTWRQHDSIVFVEPVSIRFQEGNIGAGPLSFTGHTSKMSVSTDSIAWIVNTKSEYAENYEKQIHGGEVSNPRSAKPVSESPLQM